MQVLLPIPPLDWSFGKQYFTTIYVWQTQLPNALGTPALLNYDPRSCLGRLQEHPGAARQGGSRVAWGPDLLWLKALRHKGVPLQV